MAALPDLFTLKGKSALVTGAGSGIGAAIALMFARGGARVVCAVADVLNRFARKLYCGCRKAVCTRNARNRLIKRFSANTSFKLHGVVV